jgi:hypothetical protein
MWCTVLMLALVATMDPVRLGTSVLLYSRPRPVRHLVAFWLGGVTVCIVLALGVLIGLRDFASRVIHRVQHVTTSSTVGHIQIAMGAFALLVAGLAVALSPRQRARLAMPGSSPSARQLLSSTSRLSTRAQDALQTRPLWVPFVLGVGLFTDFRYLLALSAGRAGKDGRDHVAGACLGESSPTPGVRRHPRPAGRFPDDHRHGSRLSRRRFALL